MIIILVVFIVLNREVGNEKVENFLKKEVGVDYYKNFKLKTSYRGTRKMGPLGPSDAHIIYYKYKFLPFSEKYKYYVTIGFNTDKDDVEFPEQQNLPLCTYRSGAERCSFNVSYSEAYDKALSRFRDGNFSVFLISKDQIDTWKAFKTIGNPNCEPLYQFFYINSNNGLETPTEEEQTNWCV